MTIALAKPVRGAPEAGMARPFPIDLEQPKALATVHELTLARLAQRAAPGSAEARSRLLALLIRADRFDEALALFQDAPPETFSDASDLTQAWLSYETPDANRRACAMAERAEALADDAVQRAMAMATRGKAQLRLKRAEGADTLLAALDLDPWNADAFKRLVAYLLAEDRPGAVIALVDRLAALGVGHSRLLAARTLALARRGDVAGARASVGLERFLHNAPLAAPEGWPDIATFNAALADQLTAHPSLRYERYGTASEQSWRIDEPLSRAAPLVEVALDRIRRTVAGHLATIERVDHPWMRARPAAGVLHSWSVITESTGYETWHVHQFGWLSGVYYVQVPDSIRHGSDRGGCLAWGVPEEIVGDAASQAYGLTQMRPEPGMLLLFPSHAYHRTFAHGSAERRIVLAFDIWPA